MDKKTLSVAALIALLVALGVGLVIGPKIVTVEKVTEKIIEKLGGFPGGDIFVPVSFRDEVTEGEPFFATTTPATLTGHTINQNFLRAGNYFIVTIGGSSGTNYTYTFPASTTLVNLVPRVGQTQRKCFFVVASTTQPELVFAAGTGVNFIHASTTIALQTISVPAGLTGCMTFQREPAGNNTPGSISAWLDLSVNSD